MNKAKLKTYAPQARKDFIAAVTARANQLGISSQTTAPAEKRGDILIVEGREWPASIAPQRDRLIKRIGKDGFGQTMEAVAYTWFNRFAALRYMEIHDYLGHGQRVLSSRDGGLPEVLRHAAELGLPGLNTDTAMEMQLAGNRDGELFKLILVAQCNALSSAMPFLFERIDDESELLLPDNLIRTDSIVAKLVEAIPEEDWQQVEIIGWLYQFYISDRKDEVIGKVVKSEDIPAATQLFTPNWIVQYLVQNSIGRLWMMANPASALKSQWPYYIEPAEQTPEVQIQLDALIQTRMADDGGSLNPETITVLDPACGSGHILVVAYDVLKAIYLERGYQLRGIPRLILEKNIFGLDIDDRAAQLAGFALLMKARADDRRLLDNPPRLNVLSLQESKGLEHDELDRHLKPFGISRALLASLIEAFVHAKTFGSLIQISDELARGLPALTEGVGKAMQLGDVFALAAAHDLLPFIAQATILKKKFDTVVANPPYMGSGGMNTRLKKFAKDYFPDAKSDLFACFIERGFTLAKDAGYNAMVTMQSWMFLSSFEKMRERIIQEETICTMAHLGARAFGSISGEVVQTTAFVLQNCPPKGFRPVFFRLLAGGEETKRTALTNGGNRYATIFQHEFKKIPGSPLAYWVSPKLVAAFEFEKVKSVTIGEGKNVTSDNARFVRFFWEVSAACVGRGKKWLLYAKGGDYRKWAGNIENVVDWSDESRDYYRSNSVARIIPEALWYKEGVTWNDISSSGSGFRYLPVDTTFADSGPAIFFENEETIAQIIGLLNSNFAAIILQLLNPTFHTKFVDVKSVPLSRPLPPVSQMTRSCIASSQNDWNAYEHSWEFQGLPLLTASTEPALTIESSYSIWIAQNRATIAEIKRLEEEINRLIIDAYDLSDELTSDVPIAQISLTVNPAYRYGGKFVEKEQWVRFLQDTMEELLSYAVGCMMGRYSLDEPGLIYAHAGNVGFDSTRYKTFPADADGIVPLTDELWFEDDAANRVREFLLAVWGADTLDENMAWLAESLGQKGNETPEETIRRYVSGSFYKDHLQTYKKRPIYWLFSSGKQGAFQCLVYLHRYHEGTLSRMRAEYVVPLTAKMAARIDLMNNDADAATSAAARTKINKQIEVLRKKQTELLAFDEKLRHYADMRIQLDLDEGVKVNYGKFGDLLDSVKAITGGAGDD
ncbi:MAG: hypothetical protein H6R17_1804 [Proteobacteria bacterium]|nr:hypothetical protein [Pseudomonadota bacterium]